MNKDEQAFHLKEFELLRKEVSDLLLRTESLFRYSIIVSATVYAWLLTNSIGVTQSAQSCLKMSAVFLKYAWWIPPIFVFVAGLMAFITYLRINQMGGYLKKVESALGNAQLGWESFLAPKPPMVTLTTLIVWIALFAGTFYATNEGLDRVAFSKVICALEK